ncbi:MAG TPA: YqgE/AlgH family protein [Bacteroidales bacterium]|nr:YqgE/AlgH family protein [Bacteroidales bacterium]
MELDFNLFKIEYNKVAPKKGRILVAEPFLQDNYFKRSIVLLTEHSGEGAVGFVLNKPIDVKVNEVMNGFPYFDSDVCIGGPVSTNTVHYIHTLGDIIPNAVHVVDNIYWGGDFDFIKNLIKEGGLNSDQIRFFLGYSGWHAGQLENELEQNSWLITEIKSSLIMKHSTSNVWKTTLSQLGEKYKIWSDFPENPGLN